ncbi:hypothetical protein MP638_002320, partial [Amoeboaphelidium occidentale]
MVSLNHVLSTLKINLVGLNALGVISGNDYSPNLKGCGIASNYLWLRSISSTQQTSVTDIVKKYCEQQETTNAFGKALKVFEHLKETFLRSSVYSNEIKEYSNHMSKIVREFRKAIEERKTSYNDRKRTLTNLLQKPWYTENRFRVLDHVKAKPRYAFKKVYITKANKEAVPPALKTEIQSDRGKSSDNENNKTAAPKMNPRKRNRPAAPYDKSKRAGRNKEGAAEAGTSGKRTLTEDHRDLLSLKGKHEQRLWEVGSVGIRMNPRKRNHPAAPYVKSKRAGRNKEGAAKAGASGKRTLTEDHRDLLSLKGKQEQRLWEVGSVGIRVAHGEFEEHSKQILDRLDIVVKRLNVLRRMAQVGTTMLVEHVLQTSSSDTKILEDLVKVDTKGVGGIKYWGAILRYLHSGKETRSECSAAKLFCQVVPMETFTSTYSNWLNEYSKITLSQAIEMVNRSLDSEFAGHVIGRVNLLEATVLKFDPSLSDTIAKIKHQSKCSVETFFSLNKLLPYELQWKFTPIFSVADCSITLTENALFDMLKDLCPPIKDQGEE